MNSFQSSIPSLTRSFHQSRIWRAEEQKKETETAAQDAVSESSGTTSEPLGQSEGVSSSETTTTPSSSTTSEPVGQSERQSKPVLEQASEIAEKAKDTVSDAAAKAAQAVGEFTQEPKERAQDAAASASEKASQTASKVSEQASEATSQIREQAQSAAAEATRYARNTAASTRETFQERRPYESRPPAPPSKILYIGNLFFEVTAPQLEAEFAKYGEVTNSRVVTDDRGLSKGFAYIEFINQQQADAARDALDQKVFQGRRISVQYHRRREANNNSRDNKRNQKSTAEPSKTLFIGNMSYQMSDRDLNGKKCRATSCLMNEY